MTIIALANKIILDSVGQAPLYLARSANEYARQLGLEAIRVFLATHPSGEREFLITSNETPVYTNKSYEAICCHLDMMRMAG